MARDRLGDGRYLAVDTAARTLYMAESDDSLIY